MTHLLDTNTCIDFLRRGNSSKVARQTRRRSYLAGLGLMIGPYDLMISGIALSNGLIVVTHNTSEFSRVPGLVLEDWQ